MRNPEMHCTEVSKRTFWRRHFFSSSSCSYRCFSFYAWVLVFFCDHGFFQVLQKPFPDCH